MTESCELRKCSKCRSVQQLTEKYFKLNRRGEFNKTCLTCAEKRKKYKCEHQKIRSRCKECGGSSICEHQKIRSRCKECGGGSICEHQRRRSRCKECGGSQICEHQRRKSQCKICDLPSFLALIVRTRISNALKNNKELSSKEYLCCDIETFKKHIEKQFKEGMTWENHGEWHIDHIIPVKYKQDDVEPSLKEVIKRLHYTNTQPLWADENISKGNRYIG